MLTQSRWCFSSSARAKTVFRAKVYIPAEKQNAKSIRVHIELVEWCMPGLQLLGNWVKLTSSDKPRKQ